MGGRALVAITDINLWMLWITTPILNFLWECPRGCDIMVSRKVTDIEGTTREGTAKGCLHHVLAPNGRAGTGSYNRYKSLDALNYYTYTYFLWECPRGCDIMVSRKVTDIEGTTREGTPTLRRFHYRHAFAACNSNQGMTWDKPLNNLHTAQN